MAAGFHHASAECCELREVENLCARHGNIRESNSAELDSRIGVGFPRGFLDTIFHIHSRGKSETDRTVY